MKEYIEREAALGEFDKVCDICMALVENPMCGDCSIADTVRKVKHIPAADVVEVRHGQWRDDADKIDKRFHRHDFFCKKCNTRADYFIGGEGNWWSSYAPDYCPNCGAKMDGGVNDV